MKAHAAMTEGLCKCHCNIRSICACSPANVGSSELVLRNPAKLELMLTHLGYRVGYWHQAKLQACSRQSPQALRYCDAVRSRYSILCRFVGFPLHKMHPSGSAALELVGAVRQQLLVPSLSITVQELRQLVAAEPGKEPHLQHGVQTRWYMRGGSFLVSLRDVYGRATVRSAGQAHRRRSGTSGAARPNSVHAALHSWHLYTQVQHTGADTTYEHLQDATKTLLECGIAPGARILVLAANSGALAAAEAAALSDQARMFSFA
jgi:hypothetical protein